MRYATLAGASALCAAVAVNGAITWGPALTIGPSKSEIISTTTTIYPGAMPAGQTGYLFLWLGISNGTDTGDLVQSVIGSYPKGQSECSGVNADTAWCISSEVYRPTIPMQYVGDLTTADANYANGIKLNYTLIDKSTYLWSQTMTDAVTGKLLSSFQMKSGPMTRWDIAAELQTYNSASPVGTISDQTWLDSTITFASADSSFSRTAGSSSGTTFSDMTTTDGGKTWKIAKITFAAMKSGTAAVAVSSSTAATQAKAQAISTSSAGAIKSAIPASSSSSVAVSAAAASSFPSFTAVPSEAVPVSSASAIESALPTLTTLPSAALPTGTTPAGSLSHTRSRHHSRTRRTRSAGRAAPTGFFANEGGFAHPSRSCSGSGAARPTGDFSGFSRFKGGKWRGFAGQ